MEVKYKFPRQEFVTEPTLLLDHLKEILGPVGSSVMERLIVREIRTAFSLDFKSNLPISTVISEARKKFLDIS